MHGYYCSWAQTARHNPGELEVSMHMRGRFARWRSAPTYAANSRFFTVYSCPHHTCRAQHPITTQCSQAPGRQNGCLLATQNGMHAKGSLQRSEAAVLVRAPLASRCKPGAQTLPKPGAQTGEGKLPSCARRPGLVLIVCGLCTCKPPVCPMTALPASCSAIRTSAQASLRKSCGPKQQTEGLKGSRPCNM